MNRCDWVGCSDAGVFDGVRAVLLNAKGQESVDTEQARSRFIFLCPRHFALGVGCLDQNLDEQQPAENR
jgi:hypothetical protein